MSAPEVIGKALRGRQYGRGWMACCPAHDDRSPSLSVTETRDGQVLVHCFAGCDPRDVLCELRRRGLIGDIQRSSTSRVEKRQERPANPNLAVATAMWKAAVPAIGTPVERYLKSRGIEILPPTLRFVPDAMHGPTRSRLSCMLAGVTVWPSREVHAVHRTFLAVDGCAKAAVANNKLMLGACAGGAVRLAPAAHVLLVGEGIETALSAMQATGIPAWAALSTSGLRTVILPREATTVVILSDGDDAGRDAAEALSNRMTREGRTVHVAHPPDGLDFNDLLLLPDNILLFSRRGRAA